MRPTRFILLAVLALSATAAGAAHAGGPFVMSNALDKTSRAQMTITPKSYMCLATYDAHPEIGGRKLLTSTQCPTASTHKQDACFCVVPVNGQPYAAAGKVAEMLPGGGYSW